MNTDLSFQCSKKWIIKPRKKKKKLENKAFFNIGINIMSSFCYGFLYIYNDIIESRFIHQ